MSSSVLKQHTIKELQDKLDTSFKAVLFPSSPKNLYAPINYALSMKGKRLRPLLLLMACDLFKGDVEAAMAPAIGIELFHNFTLVHDDIMDQAELRRGQMALYKQFNTNTAILSGDAMLIYTYTYFSKLDTSILKTVLEAFNDTAIKVCEGQQLDMDYMATTAVSIKAYLEMIELKTAVLLAACLKIGAVIGDAGEKDMELLYEFGKNIGLAFQLQDDILDSFGDSKKTGKQVGGDILQDKKTYLLLKAYELADADISGKLRIWETDRAYDKAEKIKSIIDIYNKLEVRKYAEEAKQQYIEKAYECLNEVSLPNERKSHLLHLTDSLIDRDH